MLKIHQIDALIMRNADLRAGTREGHMSKAIRKAVEQTQQKIDNSFKTKDKQVKIKVTNNA